MLNKTERLTDSVAQVDNDLLANVAGGHLSDTEEKLGIATLVASIGSVPLTFGCSTVGTICQYMARNAKKQCNNSKAEKLEKASRILHDVAVGIGGAGTVCALTTAVLIAKDELS